MASSYVVIGDCMVAGKSKGDVLDEQELVEWPANVAALIEGGHINPAGGDGAPVDPAPAEPVASKEG